MKKILLITILVLLSALTVCIFKQEIIKKYKKQTSLEILHQENPEAAESLEKYLLEKGWDLDEFDMNFVAWSKTSPLEFLEQLKQKKIIEFEEGINNPEKYQFTLFPSNYPPNDWIKEEHIHELIKLIDSQEPSKSIYVGTSSCIGGQTTIGHEAMHLIEGYRKGGYPPTTNSSCYFKPNVEEYQKWYQEEFLNN